ncbi:hypothetical protein [Flavobacterium coralii]|uniref:hypothetical protein n=1 Tax=Flavobacterium coralii TaxID=2838017 RepID=UPI000C3FA028|nr:hypothetical protein [Flavobacterium sp.]|tara:strand:+ start:243 stop:500 length:258 start_codon:yes stop_codon:yes gene_type:complete
MDQFTIKYPGDKAGLLNKIKSTIGDKGKLAGDEQQGSFEGSTPVGKFEGSYTIVGDDITISISKKPFLVSTGRIKDEFEKALKKV